jgi:hypothetical protein
MVGLHVVARERAEARDYNIAGKMDPQENTCLAAYANVFGG